VGGETDEPNGADEVAAGQASKQAGSRVSRRQVLATAGGAAVVGATLGPVAGAAAKSAGGPAGKVGNAPVGETATRLVGIIDQNQGSFVAYGFYTLIAGLSQAQLFSAPADPQTESNAFFTFHGTAALVQRAVVGNVFVLDVAGSLNHYYQESPASSFANPSSFASGVRIGTTEFALQDVLTQLSPTEGLAALEGQMTQVSSHPFRIGHKTVRFGKAGLKTQLIATGQGLESSHVPLVVQLSLAGSQVVTS
jgi:hypothetical protein